MLKPQFCSLQSYTITTFAAIQGKSLPNWFLFISHRMQLNQFVTGSLWDRGNKFSEKKMLTSLFIKFVVRFLWCHCKCCQLQLKWNYRMLLEVEQYIYYLICLDLRQQRMQNMLALVFWELFCNCVLVFFLFHSYFMIWKWTLHIAQCTHKHQLRVTW